MLGTSPPTSANVGTQTTKNGLLNVREAMTNAGYASTQHTIIVQNHMAPAHVRGHGVRHTGRRGPQDLRHGRGAGLVDFALIPHLDNPDHPDASLANAEKWAAKLPVPAYAIDDHTALAVTDSVVDVVSEGTWRLFSPTS